MNVDNFKVKAVIFLIGQWLMAYYCFAAIDTIRSETGMMTTLSQQTVELRAYIADFEEALDYLSTHALFKSEYAFTDYIYEPQEHVYDLNREFVRLRAYQKTAWDQKLFVLSYKFKLYPMLSGVTRFKKECDSFDEANNLLGRYRLLFTFKRTGYEFELDGLRIFLENIEGLPPSVEVLASSKEEIEQLFTKIGMTQILTDSVPKLIEKQAAHSKE